MAKKKEILKLSGINKCFGNVVVAKDISLTVISNQLHALIGPNGAGKTTLIKMISGAITGLAGALYVDLNRFVSPTSLSWQTSGELIVLVILGGSARLFGPLLGAIVFILLEQFLGEVTENWQFWLGVILVLIVLYFPKGVSGLFIKD